MAKVNLKRMVEMVDNRFISVQKHPTANLYIYNYTEKASYGKFWNNETLNSRGLIVDSNCNIVARPFGKFFNLDEHESENIPKLDLNQQFDVYEKMDGSLGILYFLDGKPYIATRGSFTSDQAVEANKILQEKYSQVKFEKEYTYLFEIIYPENRIVLDYGKTRDLILLAVIDTETGQEVEWTSSPFPQPKKYDYKRLDEIKALMEEKGNNQEGFVIRFRNGKRAKVKYTDYVRLHRLITGVTARRIWDLLRNNQEVDELLERVPEEFSQWVKDTVEDLHSKYQAILKKAISDFATIRMEIESIYGDGTGKTDVVKEYRKEFALRALKTKYPQLLFGLLKDEYSDIIWKMLRPKAEKPFKDQSDAL